GVLAAQIVHRCQQVADRAPHGAVVRLLRHGERRAAALQNAIELVLRVEDEITHPARAQVDVAEALEMSTSLEVRDAALDALARQREPPGGGVVRAEPP